MSIINAGDVARNRNKTGTYWDGKSKEDGRVNDRINNLVRDLQGLHTGGSLNQMEYAFASDGSFDNSKLDNILNKAGNFSGEELQEAADEGFISQADCDALTVMTQMKRSGMTDNEIKAGMQNYFDLSDADKSFVVETMKAGDVEHSVDIHIRGSISHKTDDMTGIQSDAEDSTNAQVRLSLFLANARPGDLAERADGSSPIQDYTNWDGQVDSSDATLNILGNTNMNQLSAGQKADLIAYIHTIGGTDGPPPTEYNAKYQAQLQTLADNLQALHDAVPTDGEHMAAGMQAQHDVEELQAKVQACMDGDDGALNGDDWDDVMSLVNDTTAMMSSLQENGLLPTDFQTPTPATGDGDPVPAAGGEDPDTDDGTTLNGYLASCSNGDADLTVEGLRGAGIPDGMADDIIALSFLFALNSINVQTDLFNDKVSEGQAQNADIKNLQEFKAQINANKNDDGTTDLTSFNVTTQSGQTISAAQFADSYGLADKLPTNSDGERLTELTSDQLDDFMSSVDDQVSSLGSDSQITSLEMQHQLQILNNAVTACTSIMSGQFSSIKSTEQNFR